MVAAVYPIIEALIIGTPITSHQVHMQLSCHRLRRLLVHFLVRAVWSALTNRNRRVDQRWLQLVQKFHLCQALKSSQRAHHMLLMQIQYLGIGLISVKFLRKVALICPILVLFSLKIYHCSRTNAANKRYRELDDSPNNAR